MALIVNIGLLFFGLAMSVSGFLIQFRYHMGHNSVSEIGYNNWSDIHKISIICISILITFHISMHRKWYKAIIIKNLVAKNRLQIILSLVFILAAITGYIPWIIDLSGGSEIARKFFIEIHDKITIILFVLLTLHLTKKLKWYINAFDKLKNEHRK